MLNPSPKLIYLQFSLSLFLFWACQNEVPQVKSKAEPNIKNVQKSSFAQQEWPLALHGFKEAYLALDTKPQIEEKVKLLQKFSSYWPVISPLLQLKKAEVYLSIGQWEKGHALAKALWDEKPHIEAAARYFIAQHAPKCRSLRESLNSTNLNQQSEAYLLAKLRLALHCDKQSQQTQAQKTLVTAFPKYFSAHHVKSLFKSESPAFILELAKSWEKKQAPEQAQKLLKGFRQSHRLSEKDEWTFKFEYERLQIERIRRDYLKSVKKLKPLTQSKSQGGRQARLLLAKALSKATRPRQAVKAYQELIREWRHSKEADQARFNLAFLYYEQGKYSLAIKGFAELTRHEGEQKNLKKYKGRAKKDRLSQNSEWYYAWCLYLKSPTKAGPFLEALIGEGLPLSSEGRRAAYWAAKAYSESKPERAAQLRKDLLAGSWGDWYSLLLRAQDPSLASADAPWPLMPPLSKAQFATQASLGAANQLSLQPKTFSLNASNQAQIETLVMQRQVAIILEQSFLVHALDQKLNQLIKDELKQDQSYSPWAIEAEQYKNLHRAMIAQDISRLRTLPKVDDHQWWRSVYPLAYQNFVQQASEAYKVSPELILSFIYKESAFAPRAISPAYAMGLMQLLEKTAIALHPDQDPPNLLDPKQNINLGTEYIAALSARYHDQVPLVAAAYNAGPQNLNTWLNKGQRKLDLFVEMIPFKEARGYVKKLSSIYCHYLFLYGQVSVNQCASQLPLTLNTQVKPGVDF